jgi:hypothetical protein
MSKSRKKYDPIDLANLKTFPMTQRQHKVDLSAQAKLPDKEASTAEFLESLPDFLGAQQLKQLARVIADAHKNNRPVVFAMGAHIIKVGCSPIIIDLMRRGIVRGIVFNGAGGIHDFEMAHEGQTSEDVGANLRDGRFGMTTEAADMMAAAARLGSSDGIGLGAALGKLIQESQLPHRDQSLLSVAHEQGVLAALHVALGTDTVHMHANADGADIGQASLIDFRKVCSIVADSGGGGVWVNIGSAVILPEVFLKAVSVARNLGADLDDMITANLDMLQHYRVQQNVLSRPVQPGNSYAITGHHEILLPLLRMELLQLL